MRAALRCRAAAGADRSESAPPSAPPLGAPTQAAGRCIRHPMRRTIYLPGPPRRLLRRLVPACSRISFPSSWQPPLRPTKIFGTSRLLMRRPMSSSILARWSCPSARVNSTPIPVCACDTRTTPSSRYSLSEACTFNNTGVPAGNGAAVCRSQAARADIGQSAAVGHQRYASLPLDRTAIKASDKIWDSPEGAEAAASSVFQSEGAYSVLPEFAATSS